MNVSPSPSPRRLQRVRPARTAAGSTDGDLGQHRSLSPGPGPGPASPGSARDAPSLSNAALQRRLGHRSTQSFSYSSYSAYSAAGPSKTVNSNGSKGLNGSIGNDSFTDITTALHPVQEYHNGFANADHPPATPPPPAASSHYASLTSASRAFLAHRRQQSIPNLLPTVASIGKTLGRAISPDRKSAPPSRPPIPVYKSPDGGSDEDDNDDSSSGSSISSSDEDSDSDGSYDSERDGEDDDRIMGSYFGDTGTRRNTNIYTTYTSRRNRNNASAAASNSPATPTTAPGGLAGWLARAKSVSPDRASQVRAATPEPSAGKNRAMSFASEASATPKSIAPIPNLTPSGATSPSRFTQLAQSMTATISRLTQQSPTGNGTPMPLSRRRALEQDPLYHLDLDAALFPSGQPSDRDAFSPSAFKNLEVNAIAVLSRFQVGYRQRTEAMLDLSGEKSARDEELEEAETRVQNFKMQLEGIAQKAAQQEDEMKALVAELAAEKKARARERAMLMSVTGGGDDGEGDEDDDQMTTTGLSEDLGVDEAQRQRKRQQKWRKSLKSDGSYSYDDTDEGDEESTPDDESSVFSRSRSPTIATGIPYENVDAPAHPRVAALGSARPAKPATPSQPLNTFQKLVKNVAAAMKEEDPFRPASCDNCRGQDVSFAWNTVSLLRDENRHLKQRVGQLEVAVEGALDAVQGIGL